MGSTRVSSNLIGSLAPVGYSTAMREVVLRAGPVVTMPHLARPEDVGSFDRLRERSGRLACGLQERCHRGWRPDAQIAGAEVQVLGVPVGGKVALPQRGPALEDGSLGKLADGGDPGQQ
jgi:hypothetical protein